MHKVVAHVSCAAVDGKRRQGDRELLAQFVERGVDGGIDVAPLGRIERAAVLDLEDARLELGRQPYGVERPLVGDARISPWRTWWRR
jgi:hypothetical protein